MEGHYYILILLHGGLKVKNPMSNPINFSPSVLMTLFHNIFAVVTSAVRVVNSLAYLMRLPPAVILTIFGSSFWDRKSTTTRAYVGFFHFARICAILSCVMTKMQFFPLVPDLSSPCAMRPNSFPKACSFQISLVTGSFDSFLYRVTVTPVIG